MTPVAPTEPDQPQPDQPEPDQGVSTSAERWPAGTRRWGDLSPRTRRFLVVVGSVEVALAAVAWIDLIRRPGDQVRGPKWRWALVIPVNIVGPLCYLRWGRLRPDVRS